MRVLLLLLVATMLTGCPSRLTGYNLKATVGQTTEENGHRTLYTGGTVDAHFDVGAGR